MAKTALADNDTRKAAAQYLLKRGEASYAEIADLLGISRQAVRQWNVESNRAKYLAKLWRDTLRKQELLERHGAKLE